MKPNQDTGAVTEKDATRLKLEQILADPRAFDELQKKLQDLSESPLAHLPLTVRNRVNYLKNLQVEYCKLEGKFYEEAHELEMKYAERLNKLYDKRRDIVNAVYEPNEEEAFWVENKLDSTDEKGEGESDEQAKQSEIDDEALAQMLETGLKMDESTVGIPHFWHTAMTNSETLLELIQPYDEPILKHLEDIALKLTAEYNNEGCMEGMGFTLEFHFKSNEFFSNSVLTKTYKMNSEVDMSDPFAFDGPDIVACTGCKIDWNKGKNVTEKEVHKKQKHKGRGQTRVVKKMVKQESFFNFFNPPEVPDEGDDEDEEVEESLSADFNIGNFLRESFIPKAILFYTGEAIENDSDDESEDEDEEEDEDDEENEEEENTDANEGKPQECQQQ